MSGMRVLDVDERGRLLKAVTDGGTTTLVEVDAKGTRERAAVGALATARYLPGERTAVVQHGSPAQLSLLHPNGKMAPLLGSPTHDTELVGVLPGRVVYRANRRHRLLYTLVIRNVLVGEEQAVYDRGGSVEEAAVSANSRHIAIRLPRKLLLVDTMPVTEDDHVRLITPEPPGAGHRDIQWLPDSQRLLSLVQDGGTTSVTRWDVATQEWDVLVTGLAPQARLHLAPDGRRFAVGSDSGLALYEAGAGRYLRDGDVGGGVDSALWTPDSRRLVVERDGEALWVEAESGAVSAVAG
ncbi:WD40 repeat domain-containing protein [Actinokineospora bangkokensis]|uniref:Lipoprotein LpqB beta-propeller domain-containing protein n=1 Tax=Actinokineospora bangkokensis TaxID=1193682 RepID=A0A1Q9LCB5_9PSEU|nr:hypothetical protein [Actinokineospora bangkokensis]OLR89668.1 hypothetical protein BJP25_01110 [Actinokineospora bangkokensis]